MLSTEKASPHLSTIKTDLISYPKKPELLAPVGNYEKLEIAIHYGADAVYLGGKDFSLRNFSGNFTEHELESAVYYAHKHNVKVYVTCNIFSRNSEHKEIASFLETIGDINADAIIIADPGIILMARQIIPHIDIHLSTQANTTNLNAVKFWEEIGVKRINLARELSLDEIREIIQNSKSNLSLCKSPIEIETFVHGAMCISYSGRCLLSSALTGRDSNRGLCSHPCRWKYAVVEEQRPGEYQPVMEDKRGAYIFNSKDLCMIDHIPELCDAGISSLKIEGRMKGISYLASVVKTYREALDSYITAPKNYTVKEIWHKELDLIYHRTYCTGFYFNSSNEVTPNYLNIHGGSIHSFIGKIIKYLPDNNILVQIRNKISVGDIIEVLPPKGEAIKSKIIAIYDINNHPILHAQPNSTSILQLECLEKISQLTSLNIVRKVS
ncbi:MAG: U32 family peptidase [Desulfamplus sp.]|nr:U32 family peptidase [Desulfamplus sp.]